MQVTLSTGLYQNTDMLKLTKTRLTVQVKEGVTRLQNVYHVIALNPETGDVHELHQYDTLKKAQRKFNRLNSLNK